MVERSVIESERRCFSVKLVTISWDEYESTWAAEFLAQEDTNTIRR